MDADSNGLALVKDPLTMVSLCWPHIRLYDKQVQIMESVRDNDQTLVYAGNQLGKDFISGLIVLWFFLSRSPCRVITSSAGQSQLRSVLWGEITNFILTSVYPLPLVYNDLLLRQELITGTLEPKSYVRGIVTNTPENLQGHHLARGPNDEPSTLMLFDEASGIKDEFKDASDTWAHRTVIIGNPLPCSNFFFKGAKAGNIKRDNAPGYHSRVMQIKGSESPNVRLAEAQKAKGKKPTGEVLLEGVLSYNEYLRRRKMWDPVRQCIGIDAEFYEGAEVLLFPPDWLNGAEEANREIVAAVKALFKKRGFKRKAKAMGVDTAEGGDNTVWTPLDDKGVISQHTASTTDTAVIPGRTIGYIKKYNIDPHNVIFDSGGGGKQHADILRKMGYPVRNVGFGQSPSPATEEGDEETAYRNLRIEMYHQASLLLDPSRIDLGLSIYGIPESLTELRRQLAVMPLLYDGEGKMYLPPKDNPSPTYKGDTLKSILGCSPDEADSFVLGIYGLQHPIEQFIATAL